MNHKNISSYREWLQEQGGSVMSKNGGEDYKVNNLEELIFPDSHSSAKRLGVNVCIISPPTLC
jgi:hypothetical protein